MECGCGSMCCDDVGIIVGFVWRVWVVMEWMCVVDMVVWF